MKFYYVYILYNHLKKFIYIGYTEDLKIRIVTHNKGNVTSTKAYIPLELIHYEAYKNQSDAKRREKYLKTNKGRNTLKTMLMEYYNEKNKMMHWIVRHAKILRNSWTIKICYSFFGDEYEKSN